MNIREISQSSQVATITLNYKELKHISSALHKLDHEQLDNEKPCTNDVYRLALEMDMVKSILHEGAIYDITAKAYGDLLVPADHKIVR